MAKRGVSTRTQVVNPLFPIPEELENFVYEAPNQRTGFVDYDDEVAGDPVGDQLMPPNELVVVDQIIHRQPDGTYLVDLVVEVTDVPGAVSYDFRTVKV